MLDFQILQGLWPGRDWMRTALLPIGHSMAADRRDAELMRVGQELGHRARELTLYVIVREGQPDIWVRGRRL